MLPRGFILITCIIDVMRGLICWHFSDTMAKGSKLQWKKKNVKLHKKKWEQFDIGLILINLSGDNDQIIFFMTSSLEQFYVHYHVIFAL